MKEKKFSGWLVVVGCFILMAFVYGIIYGTTALFMTPICTEFGFPISQYSVINLISNLANAVVAMFLAPKLQQKMRPIMLVCGIVAGGAFCFMGFCAQLWQFFLVFTICNMAVAGVTQLPVSILITSWFNDRRSIAMSLALCGSNAGAAVWSILFGSVIENYGWRICYYMGGIMAGVVAVIVVFVFLKSDPASVGQKPYTQENPGEQVQKAPPADTWQGVTKEVALKTPSFYLLVLGVLLLGCTASGVPVHIINYLIQCGWDMAHASTVLSVFSVFGVPGLFLGGVLFEKLGARKSILLGVISTILGLLGVLAVPRFALLGYSYSIFFAFGMMMPMLIPSMLPSVIFGVRDYGAIYSYINMVFMVGCSFGSVLTGIIYEKAGYQIAWIMYIVFAVLIFICSSFAISGNKRLRERYPNM